MSSQEERLTAVEYDFRRFKADSVKAYQDLAMEVTAFRELASDSVKRLIGLKSQVQGVEQRLDTLELEVKQGFAESKQRFNAVDQRFNDVDQRFNDVDRRLDSLDQKFEQVLQLLARLAGNAEQGTN
ncbi:MAG TPA: hypothetical protein VKX46_23155 [Ktedonobacteraceae bacterium]|nr:hypothetical protein [Ktedonobacteraceae bacterium]